MKRPVMTSQQKRQLYSKLMRWMALFAACLLLVVMVRGLFYQNLQPVSDPIARFTLQVLPEKIQLLHWNGQEIAILHRTPAMLASLASRPNVATTLVESTRLNPQYRSVRLPYFVFYNQSGGVGCPLHLRGVRNTFRLRDSCTQADYDLAGRPLQQGGKALRIPTHAFSASGEEIVLGTWNTN